LRRHGEELWALRHELHRRPELSGSERGTARRVVEALSAAASPDEIIEGLGGHGVAALFQSSLPGPTVLLRAELDALPMMEPAHLPYRSGREGVAHKCGHDGHMATLVGVATVLAEVPLPRGRVVLLFQPAEETGAGAAKVLADPAFERIRPDAVLAYHNLPGLALGEIHVRPEVMTLASVGLCLRLRGIESHASTPQLGRSPARASARFVDELLSMAEDPTSLPDGALMTVTAIHMGERSFGISPGEAEILLTLRCDDAEELTELVSKVEALAGTLAAADGLELARSRHDEFPSSRNDAACASLVARVADELGLATHVPTQPFPWSEDFGHFLQHAPGALFVVGAGEEAPALHTPDYDFPDALIEPTALLMLCSAFELLEEKDEPIL
jgi:amidohydrolase